jgi:hydroxyacylglutathione hydrolase
MLPSFVARYHPSTMQITIVPCLEDNYAYLVRPEGANVCCVVDACEADPVERALDELGLRLGAILATHHHGDHVGGNETLARRFPGIEVFGSAHDRGRIPAQNRFVEDGETIETVGLAFRCLAIPGHTLGAVAYVGYGSAFTGDTLFAAGCGRLFEGTPALMYTSLVEKLGALPDDTRVYFGHEYTANNLRFAAHVEPNNPHVREKVERVAAQLARGEFTAPSTLGEERLTNPFLRVASPEKFAEIRALKDKF